MIRRGRAGDGATRTGRAAFIDTMDCLPVPTLPEGPHWTYEIKLDGYRLEAVKSAGRVQVYSRRKHRLNEKFGYIAAALEDLPEETVLDGEIVAMDEEGRSNFNLLLSFRSAALKIHYFAFDVLMLEGRSLIEQPLVKRRALLEEILPRNEHVGLSAAGHSARPMLRFVTDHGLEGVVAKRSDSLYEPGKRSGAWSKYRVNLGQEFVVGGFTPGHPFDALIVGFYRGNELSFASRVRAGFLPAVRHDVMARLQKLLVEKCPFANLPEKEPGRWGQGLTAEKMKGCRWVKPRVVVRLEFAAWTPGDKLRHAQFVALRDDKDPRKVVKEG